MIKITFMGAGSTVFTKNVLGDCMLTESLKDAHYALYDIDAKRLEDSRLMLENMNRNINDNRAEISAHHGEINRTEALRGADFVINAIQIGGYRPATVIDFEIPKKYGLRQTIGDTLGIGGIFRGLRTIPVLRDFAEDIAEAAPDAWFLNYTNPMSILTGYLQRHTPVKTVGLCHSVQGCVAHLLKQLEMDSSPAGLKWVIAGINHMSWLLEVSRNGKDLYPEIKRRAIAMNDAALREGADKHDNMVRFEMLRHFGCYNTESSEHTAEYHPYFVNSRHPELIDKLNIPLDEYPRRCEKQIAKWETQREELIGNQALTHVRSPEYGSLIIDAIIRDDPIEIGGNVINRGLISNLPDNACVEVPCMVNRNGIQGCYVGALPEHLAALNRTHVNVHLLTIEAAASGDREKVYHAAMMDPHTRAELTLDQIRALCDDMFEAHAEWLPDFRP